MSRYTTTFIILLLAFPLLLTAQNRQWQWAHRAGGDGFNQNNHHEEGVDVALDNNGDAYVCGQIFPLATFDTVQTSFNYADRNIFLAKYNCEGGLAWKRIFGSDREDVVNSIATDDNNNVYITGVIPKGQFQNAILGDDTLTAFGGFYVSKFDSAGNHVWNKIAYADNTIGNEMAIGPDDHLYILGGAGFKRTIFSKYQVERGQFILKMNSLNGSIQWVQPFGHNPTDSVMNVNDMVVDAKGNMYFAGWNNSDTLFFHNAVIPRKSDNSDIIVSKFDSSGQFRWVRRAGGSSGANTATGPITTKNGEVLFSGHITYTTTSQKVDFGDTILTNFNKPGSVPFLASYNANGTVKWVRAATNINHGNAASGGPTDITNSGNIIWGGEQFDKMKIGGHLYTIDPNRGGAASYFARHSPFGSFQEGFQPAAAGSKGSAAPLAIAAGYHNSMVFTGQFEERVVMNDLGDTINNTGGGDFDIITAKYGTGDCSVPDDSTGTSIKPAFGTTYKSITVSPNPVSGSHLQLQLSRSFEQDAAARIVSATGRTVWEGELPRGSNTIKPEQELSSGLYILELQTEGARYTGKVVVMSGR